jgi:hypothetical protein
MYVEPGSGTRHRAVIPYRLIVTALVTQFYKSKHWCYVWLACRLEPGATVWQKGNVVLPVICHIVLFSESVYILCSSMAFRIVMSTLIPCNTVYELLRD